MHLSNIRKYSYKEEGIVLIDPVLDAVRHSLYFRGKKDKYHDFKLYYFKKQMLQPQNGKKG